MLYSGPPDGLETGRGIADPALPVRRTAHSRPGRRARRKGWLRLAGVTRNNLHGLDVAFPLGRVHDRHRRSGSGKSSLVSQALVELVAEHLGHRHPRAGGRGRGAGAGGGRARRRPDRRRAWKRIKRLVRVDQKPIGRTPRSNLATYTGLFDHVRKLFAATKAGARPPLRRRALLVQRRQGALRDLRGRRLRDGRAAVPAERLCAVPGLSWGALQRQDAGDQIPRTRPSPTCWG